MLLDVEICSSAGMTQSRRELPKGSKDAGPMKTKAVYPSQAHWEGVHPLLVRPYISKSVLVLRQLLPTSLM